MKNKGFTLAELIGVIVVLSLIVLITVPAVSTVLSKNKTQLCKTQLDNILMAANSYASENLLSMPNENGEFVTITVRDLIEKGFISDNMVVEIEDENGNIKEEKAIENPLNKEAFDNDIVIKIIRNNKKLEVKFSENNVQNPYDYCIDEDE